MAWFTTKDGRHVNTEWFTKDKQIQQNAEEAFKLNKQFNIDYDSWQKKEDTRDDHYDEEHPYSVRESDETRYIMDKDIRKISKKKALDDIEQYKMDDDTYGFGQGDESIWVIYDDGRYFELTDGEPHKRWSKQGIRGISISTGDYEIAWGEEYYPKDREWRPIRTHEFDEDSNEIEGFANSYSGYKATGKYKVRLQEVMFLNEQRKRWEKKYKTLAMSTVKKI